MAQVASKLDGRLWIDCTDKAIEGMWICGEDEPAGMGYRSWSIDNGQPNDYPPGADFATMYKSGQWSDYPFGVSRALNCHEIPKRTLPHHKRSVPDSLSAD